MMTRYRQVREQLRDNPKKWLVTGAAGFIGSNLLESLLRLGQTVIGLDNFATGYQKNLDEVMASVTQDEWSRFSFIMGDIQDYAICERATTGVDYILHQAALGSVPRSILDPITTNAANIDGFLNMMHAAKEAKVQSFTYAASSSTYGDHPALPKVEETIGNPLSPYAVTKYVNELYAAVYERTYNFKSIGLRYFNVFGKRQDPNGAYAAVIPKWIAAMIQNQDVVINGDGETSRDFCFIENTVQMNILAATATEDAKGHVYNVAVGDRTTLNELFEILRSTLFENGIRYNKEPICNDFRIGDVRHSQASIEKATDRLGYKPAYPIKLGIREVMPWYIEGLTAKK